jgi:hypothetical protein
MHNVFNTIFLHGVENSFAIWAFILPLVPSRSGPTRVSSARLHGAACERMPAGRIHLQKEIPMKYVVHGLCAAAVLLSSTVQAATLSLTDKLTAYHSATPAERSAVVPLALAAVESEIDRKGKTDAEISAEVLPCMNSVDEQVSEADRATQPVLDLAAVCLAQLGYKK